MQIKALIISSYDDTYNAVRPEGEILIGMHKAGIEVAVMTQGYTEYAKRFREQGLKVIDFHPDKKISVKAVKFIRNQLKEGGYQILHLFNNKAIVNGILAAWNLPVKILTYRGMTGKIFWYNPKCYLTHLNPRVDKITCLSDSVKDHFKRQLLRRPDKAITVNKGHDLSWYKEIKKGDLSQFDIPADAFVISCVANARRTKGIQFLIKSTDYLPKELNIHFLLIGKKMDTPGLMKLVEKSPYRDKIHFAGFRQDALELVLACNASVLPSIGREATPKAVIEAMCLGKAVIFTSIPGNKGMAEHLESAYIVPPGSAEALAEAILYLWKNPDVIPQMGDHAKKRISEKLSNQRSVREMMEAYRGVLA